MFKVGDNVIIDNDKLRGNPFEGIIVYINNKVIYHPVKEQLFKVGDKVRAKEGGEGIIEKCWGALESGDNNFYAIKVNNHGRVGWHIEHWPEESLTEIEEPEEKEVQESLADEIKKFGEQFTLAIMKRQDDLKPIYLQRGDDIDYSAYYTFRLKEMISRMRFHAKAEDKSYKFEEFSYTDGMSFPYERKGYKLVEVKGKK